METSGWVRQDARTTVSPLNRKRAEAPTLGPRHKEWWCYSSGLGYAGCWIWTSEKSSSRMSVNKGKKKDRSLEKPRPSAMAAYHSTLR